MSSQPPDAYPVERTRWKRSAWSRSAELALAPVIALMMLPPLVPEQSNGYAGIRPWTAGTEYEAGEFVTYHGQTWEAVADVAAGHEPLGVGDGSDRDQRLLLSRRVGFGRNVTGGYVPRSRAEVVYVTTDADSGPGSMREAVSGDEPRWVLFAHDYQIRLTSGLRIGSNKTIDGRGRDVLIQAPDDGDGNNWGLQIYNESNVIVHNIRIDECGDYTRQALNDPYDCIDIEAASRVWIDHVSLSQAVDKLIDVQIGARRITVSWSHFWEHVPEAADTEYAQQVFQIGSGWAGQTIESASTITSHHNYFDDTGYRHPVVSYGKVHAFNNYVYSFSLYGMQSERQAQMYIEGNVFENTDGVTKEATTFEVGGNGCNDDGTICDDRDGYIKATNNVAVNARIHTHQPGRVFDPHALYAYTVDPPDEALKALLEGFAGWQPLRWRRTAGTVAERHAGGIVACADFRER